MNRIKNLIFDVGDVLIQYRWKDMLMDCGLSEPDAARIGRELFDDPDRLWSVFDLGTMTEDEVIAEFCRKYPEDAEIISWFIHHGEYMHVPRPAVWKLVYQLKSQGYGIYLLSNYPERLFKKHTEYADFMNDIDGLMVSYMIHKAKPDAAIYEALFQKYDLKPSECMFFDDRAENVQAAKELGMSAVRVMSQEGLLEDLRRIEEFGKKRMTAY
ncbi:MAG: HAD family phosphatase [Lachnospiraceae bacterium]|nr:HAD family phosphatase [Lachnospiraceae bacterium]